MYGLLKPGLSLHHLVAPYVERMVPATARGQLYDAGVPAARFDEEGEIEGFVLWLDAGRLAEALAILDDIEDEGDVYSRIAIEATTPEGPVSAQAYHYRRTLRGRLPVGRVWPEA